MSSPEFAKRLERTFVDGLSVVILVGGAYGFDADVRERADMVWSFSQLVFPHMLFRVMLIEQIYRAQEISGGRKYHHE